MATRWVTCGACTGPAPLVARLTYRPIGGLAMPERIQQRRTKGWRKPENTVSVARPSKWGNPFTITAQPCEEIEVAGICFAVGMQDRPMYLLAHEPTMTEARAVAVEAFASGARTARFGYTSDDVRRELGGKNLMCFCPLDQPCHADVLLEIANGDTDADS